MIRRPPRSTRVRSSAASDVYKRQESKGVHPFAARRHHVDAWVKALARDPQPATGRPAAAATIARRLSCLSKFYDYGMREVELIEHSPVANVRRPKVTEDSPTIGLDAAELDRLLTAAV